MASDPCEFKRNDELMHWLTLEQIHELFFEVWPSENFCTVNLSQDVSLI